ncbi:Restriction endonuclease [Haloarcula vallismortis]|uniref:Restriction endonuclease type IV Mrr domain-containing protein n=2 Tax=Haloarcula vallismortis TaxID=28442 RepID=M0J931_HALVA|nr:restriction endonuclease [Haloarcula vallismortis]EMA05622.1 hypothetical protein C437_12371 [Haloarcula vallismortis ATCC 29715]SDX40130.1 Restriction endonuclease [Haloarcula vallismortis]
MPQTELETALANIYPQDLEKLAADLLSERGYDVEPTGTTGADGGLDALLRDGERIGALHVSRTTSGRVREKIRSDVGKVQNHERTYDFFVFITTADLQGTFRRRLEAEVQDDYGWKTDVWAREQLRNTLMTDHQRLAREHLGVDPNTRLNDHQDQILELRDNRLDRIQDREALPNSIPAGPTLAIHVVPNGVFSTEYADHPDDLPSLPLFGHNKLAGAGKSLGNGVVAYNSRFRTEHPDYVYLDEAGWIEAVSTEYFRPNPSGAGGFINQDMDKAVCTTVLGALRTFCELGVKPPVYVSVSLLDVENYAFDTGEALHFEPQTFPNRYAPPLTGLERTDPEDFSPETLQPLLDRFWYQAGRSNGSPHFSNS